MPEIDGELLQVTSTFTLVRVLVKVCFLNLKQVWIMYDDDDGLVVVSAFDFILPPRSIAKCKSVILYSVLVVHHRSVRELTVGGWYSESLCQGRCGEDGKEVWC